MVDWDDLGDSAWVASMVSSGPLSLVFLLLVGVCALMYCDQVNDCSKKHCTPPQVQHVVQGECVCLAPAGP